MITETQYAQGFVHELYMGYGVFSTNKWIDNLSDLEAIRKTGTQRCNKMQTGPFHFGYKLHVSEKSSIGAMLVHDYVHSDNMLDEIKLGYSRHNYFALILGKDHKYLDTGKLCLYLTFAAGIIYGHQKYIPMNESDQEKVENIIHLNFQVVPIGIKYGENIGVFLELGVGCKGVINAGVFGRF